LAGDDATRAVDTERLRSRASAVARRPRAGRSQTRTNHTAVLENWVTLLPHP